MLWFRYRCGRESLDRSRCCRGWPCLARTRRAQRAVVSCVPLERRRKRSLVGRNLKHAGTNSPRLGRNSPKSLQQQTATAEVLKVISRSTFDLKSVLQALVKSAARPCDADKSNVTRQIDGVFYRANPRLFRRIRGPGQEDPSFVFDSVRGHVSSGLS